jgi:DNA-binding response OmpR family regulator
MNKRRYNNNNKCLLVIDDENWCRQQLAKCFSEHGFAVIQADGPIEACGFLKEKENAQKINAIILDIMMPDEDMFKDKNIQGGRITGIFLLGEIKSIFTSLGILMPKVLIYSAIDIAAIRHMADKVADKFITKPCQFKELLDAIQEIL